MTIPDLLAGADVGLLARTVVGLAVMVAATVALQRWARVDLGWQPVVAVIRALVQLAVIALVLRGVLAWPALVIAFVAIMLTTASLTSAERLAPLVGARRAAVLGVVVGGLVATGLVLLLGLVPLDARNVVAIGGILIGNAMTASTLTGRGFRTQALHRTGEIEGWLALGARPAQAHDDIGRSALHDALVPTIDTTRSTGLVTLPGAFVGALFGGASPLEAARFQLVVLVGIMLAQVVTGVIVTRVLGASPTLPAEAR